MSEIPNTFFDAEFTASVGSFFIEEIYGCELTSESYSLYIYTFLRWCFEEGFLCSENNFGTLLEAPFSIDSVKKLLSLTRGKIESTWFREEVTEFAYHYIEYEGLSDDYRTVFDVKNVWYNVLKKQPLYDKTFEDFKIAANKSRSRYHKNKKLNPDLIVFGHDL